MKQNEASPATSKKDPYSNKNVVTGKQKPTVDFKQAENAQDKNTKDAAPFKNFEKVNTKRSLASDDDVVAPITLAPDGGWGWVVVAASFWHIFNLEGISFSFGTMKSYIMEDMNTDFASIALINSIAVGFMCFFGPVSSALINKFGFRMISMCGSTMSAFAAFISSFAINYPMLLIFYGMIMGMGFSLIVCSANLIVGFYFEKRRALATALAMCGSSVGISVNAYTSHYLNRKGWRPTILYQSAMLGTIFFTSMVYKPLLSITVQVIEPTLKKQLSTPYINIYDAAKSKKIANSEYKLAVDFIDEQYDARKSRELTLDTIKKGKATSRIVSTVELPKLTQKYSKVQAVIDLGEETDNLLITINNTEDKKRKRCCERFFSLKPHVKEARPLYRDDAFYTGNIKKLEDHSKSVIFANIDENKAGIEYDLTVSRVTTAKDFREKGVFTTAIKRVLVSMADPRLLKLKSFSIFLLGVFFSYLGLVIPYIFILDRSKALNMPKKHYEFFVSVIAFAGLFGRLSVGLIATKIPAVYWFQLSAFIAGSITIISNYFTECWSQYLYCILYGFFMSGMVVSRYLVLIDLYGLELLTNGSGLVMFTMGLSILISPPTAGMILTHFGVFHSFVYSGSCCIAGGLCLCFVPFVRKSELNAAQ